MTNALLPGMTTQDYQSLSFRQDVVIGDDTSLQTMPMLMVQDGRHNLSSRLDNSTGHTKKHDAKKFFATLENVLPAVAVLAPCRPRGDFSQPVPDSWYGFSFSPRSPPLPA